ncbi:thioredoxin reductase [Spirochaetia bacterium]|nr:thioredoxin reductase [Spirochaetia bacterium]
MSTNDADLIIIGAGPAGLTAAQYGARANLKVLAIEQLAPGGQALLIDVLENYPGNVGAGDAPPKTGFEFSQDLHKQAESFGAQFLSESVLSLKRGGNLFTLTLGNGEKRTAPAVILATGAQHRTLDVPGEAELSGRGVSYCATCDGPFFRNKKIFVAGGGDAACDEAQYLSRLSSQVVLVHRREHFRAQKALAERTLHNPNIEVRFNTRIREIRGPQAAAVGPQKVASVILERTGNDGKGIGETYEEAADAVFIFAGTIPQTSLVPDAEKDENGYIITDQKMASSVPGLFIAGDVRASPFRQVVVAAAEGAIAAHCAAEYLDRLNG